MSISKKVANASILIILRKVWGGLITFFVTAYLARALTKEDFGLLAITTVLITLIELFFISGVGEYLIFYNKPDRKKVVNSSFWLTILLSLIICIIVVAILPFWSNYYNDSRIVKIGYILLINFFFTMISAIPSGLLRKELQYKPLIASQALVGTLTNLSQIVFAYTNFGVYSLALPKAIFAPLLTILLLYKSNFTPTLNIETKYWKEIFNYTKYVIGQRIFGKFVNEGDTLLIGKFYGMASLGLYNIAFQFSNLINGYFLPVVTSVSLPMLAKFSYDNSKLKVNYYRMIRIICYVFLPLIVLFAIFSKHLVLLLYGEKWTDSVIFIKILLIYVYFSSISSPSSSIFNAIGKPKISFLFVLIFSPIFLLSLIIASYYYKNLIVTVAVISVVRSLGSLVLINLSLRVLGKNILYLKQILFIVLLSLTTMIINVFFDFNIASSIIFCIIYLTLLIIFYYSNKSEAQIVINEIKLMYFKKNEK